jgi:hypothetical protein
VTRPTFSLEVVACVAQALKTIEKIKTTAMKMETFLNMLFSSKEI